MGLQNDDQISRLEVQESGKAPEPPGQPSHVATTMVHHNGELWQAAGHLF
jgi:hypothetical protein